MLRSGVLKDSPSSFISFPQRGRLQNRKLHRERSSSQALVDALEQLSRSLDGNIRVLSLSLSLDNTSDHTLWKRTLCRLDPRFGRPVPEPWLRIFPPLNHSLFPFSTTIIFQRNLNGIPKAGERHERSISTIDGALPVLEFR